MKYEIKHRFSGAVLFAAETDTFRLAVEAAVKAKARLDYASLDGASLVGASLVGASLNGARLNGAGGKKLKLDGKRPCLQIGPLGSRCATLLVFLTDCGVYVRAGCFFDTLGEFRARVIETHGTNEHAQEYAAAIALIEAHARLWTPAAEITPEAV